MFVFLRLFLVWEKLENLPKRKKEFLKNEKRWAAVAFCIFLLPGARIACSSRANQKNTATSSHAGWCPLQATLKQSMKKLNSRGQIIPLAKGPNTVVKKSGCRTFPQKISNFLVHVVLISNRMLFSPIGMAWSVLHVFLFHEVQRVVCQSGTTCCYCNRLL